MTIQVKEMKDFITEIRKRKTEDLLLELSELSIKMFHSETPHMKNLQIDIGQNGFWKTREVLLTTWDILNIEYLSIKNSNDYRDSKRKVSIGELVNLYRGYDNNKKDLEYLKYESLDVVFRTILGMTAEQFQYQDLNQYYERFNRNYHILVAAKNFEHRNILDVAAATNNVFGYEISDYLSVLLMVYWLCTKDPEPLSAPESVYRNKDVTVFTKNNISKFVQYYSCSYEDLRKSSLGKQLLYAKPFIKTDRHNKYVACSLSVVAMLLSNGLYWLVRDYYQTIGSQSFPNKFGLLFEDYIKDLASRYCSTKEWNVIPQGKTKGADFIFDFGKIRLLIESKSSLLKLDGKQQIPNLQSVNTFFERNIKESYTQLNESFSKYSDMGNSPIAKIILLYDEFSNTSTIEHSMMDIFQNDNSCFIMTIRQFEILLFLHQNDTDKCSSVFQSIAESIKQNGERKSIDKIYNELGIYKNPHFQGDMDYFTKQLEHFKANMK